MVKFEYQLARELGMTHAELLWRMSGAEFAAWIALYSEEARDRERAERDAQDKANAAKMARGMGR